MSRWVYVVAGLLVAGISGCDGGDGDTTSTPPPPPPPSFDAGCSSDLPHRAGITPVQYSAKVVVCTSPDATSLQLENTSHAVLRVFIPAGFPNTHVSIDAPAADDVDAQASLTAVPGGCVPGQADCTVPVGGTFHATSSGPIAANFQELAQETVLAGAAAGLAAWAVSKGQPKSLSLVNSAVHCGEQAQQLLSSSSPYLSDSLRAALDTTGACSSFVQQVNEADAAPKDESALKAGVLEVTHKVNLNAFDDVLLESTIRILAHR